MVQRVSTHGIYLWFLTHSHFEGFWSFLERVGINHNKCLTSLHLWEINNKVLDIFGGIVVVKVKMNAIMVGI